MISQLFGSFILIGLAISMFPTVQEATTAAAMNISSSNMSNSSSAQVLQIVPFFFVGVILLMAIAMAYGALKQAGLIGDEPDYVDDEEDSPAPTPKSHKQTYEEYVRERQNVEGMLK